MYFLVYKLNNSRDAMGRAAFPLGGEVPPLLACQDEGAELRQRKAQAQAQKRCETVTQLGRTRGFSEI